MARTQEQPTQPPCCLTLRLTRTARFKYEYSWAFHNWWPLENGLSAAFPQPAKIVIPKTAGTLLRLRFYNCTIWNKALHFLWLLNIRFLPTLIFALNFICT